MDKRLVGGKQRGSCKWPCLTLLSTIVSRRCSEKQPLDSVNQL